MIHNQDRSRWFGASDTARIMGNWNTPTFARWWLEKLGVIHNSFSTVEMRAGTAYEHKVLEALGISRMDRQIKIRRLRLRVNLDGEDDTTVHEVKTHKNPVFKVSTAYWQQCQVEMFATEKGCVIDAYRLEAEDYENFFREIDTARLSYHEILYDPRWIEEQYLPRLEYLADCLKRRKTPSTDWRAAQ